jgi:phosphoribosylamine---glycine ligase
MMKKNILIIGSGAREHALGWKLKQSPKVNKIYFTPGTAGTELIGENTGIDILDTRALIQFAKTHDIYLTVAGPDDALAAGVVDAFKKEKLKIFGPTKDAAQIESSKSFAKQLMADEGIPTAIFQKFSDPIDAKKYVEGQNLPIVIKASGLALGKGVIIAKTLAEAKKTIDDMLVEKVFGKAGDEIIIEEFLEGQEISIHAFCDGKTVSLFPVGKDHKSIFEENKGPNTGGMGTLAPVPAIRQNFLEEVKNTIVLPTLHGLKKKGITFTGCLYPGLILTKQGPKVLEFNSRFGDPEMESYMRILETDLFDILEACADGKLEEIKITWSKKTACCIVLASSGYPGTYKKGEIIHGLETFDGKNDIVVFHFGTKKENGEMTTNGGRVLGITATGETLELALQKAYSVIGMKGIHFRGMQYRKDIGKTVLRGMTL